MLVPFFLWDAGVFLDDTVLSLSGVGPHPVPITDSGLFGAAGVVLALGWVSSRTDPFPFWIIQVPLTAAVVWVFSRQLLCRRSLALVGLAYAVSAATWLHLGRISALAYFGVLLSMAVVAGGFERASAARGRSGLQD